MSIFERKKKPAQAVAPFVVAEWALADGGKGRAVHVNGVTIVETCERVDATGGDVWIPLDTEVFRFHSRIIQGLVDHLAADLLREQDGGGA